MGIKMNNKPCSHLNASIDVKAIKKVVEITGLLPECNECTRKALNSGMMVNNNLDCDNDALGLWLCLFCGNQACGRKRNKHALRHHLLHRQHYLVVCTKSWTVWCYKCSHLIDITTQIKLHYAINFLKKHLAPPKKMEISPQLIGRVEEFECPVCYNYMHPPIRQCLLGHSFCQNCFKKINVCPLCRKEKCEVRNFTLENFYNNVEIPCIYKENGCDELLKIATIEEHTTKKCNYRDRLCLFHENLNCQWLGQYKNMVDHLQSEHNDDISENDLIVVDLHKKKFKTIHVQKCFNKYFVFLAENNSTENYLKLCVYYLGSTEIDEKYTYSITLTKGKENMIFVGPCFSYESGDFADDKCIIIHHRMVEKIIQADYKVEVIKNCKHEGFIASFFKSLFYNCNFF